MNVVVLTGFLGAGKTTLLKKLAGPRVGVVLNEIGTAGIDAVSARVFSELVDACACCVRTSDFEKAMREMAARTDIDRIILETTGIADPLPIMWRIEAMPEVSLQCVVTVVDPTHDTYSRDEWIAQVQAADFVVISKTDLADADIAREAVLRMQPRARFLDAGAVADTLASEIDLARPELPKFAPARHSRLSGLTHTEPGTFSLSALELVFAQLPEAVLRAKAIVKTDEGWARLDRVGERMDLDLAPIVPTHDECRFAFFGDGVESIGSDLISLIQSAKLKV